MQRFHPPLAVQQAEATNATRRRLIVLVVIAVLAFGVAGLSPSVLVG